MSVTRTADDAETVPNHTRRAAVVVVLVATALSVATAVLVVIGLRAGATVVLDGWLVGCFAPGFVISGWLLVHPRRAVLLGWMYLAAGVTTAVAGVGGAWALAASARGWPGVDWSLWLVSWVWQPHMTLAAMGTVLFPTERVRSRWWQGFLAVAAVIAVMSMIVTAVAPGDIRTTPDHPEGVLRGVKNPWGITAVPALRPLGAVLLFLILVVGLVAVANVTGRFLAAKGALRQQLKWVAISQVIAVPLAVIVTGVPRSPIVPVLAIGQTLLLQLVIVAAILRWHLYGVNVAVRRSVLALSLLAGALTLYVGVVGLIALVLGRSGTLVSGAGAVVTALVFGPLSSAIRRWVDQLFYGRRRDPYAIVSVLVRRLGDVAGPEDALVGIAAALCTELRIPYVSIAAASGALLAEQGRPEPRDEPSRFELHHQGNRVGTLSVGHRRGEAQLAGREERLLADLARHVGAAVHAASLVADLRLARDRLVHAREEERRRLQRDLHDGLGPRLTAVKLMVDAATNHLSRHPEEARPQLQSARSELGVAVADIRRLVNQLGDPALDSLGLVGAIKELGTRFAHDGLDVTVDAGWVPPLPPAIEVAAFRIASEALANVARHAGASRCDIRIVADTSLRLTITDDGHGLSPSMRHGVGLVSMEQRATELGGQCVVITGPPGGVEVCVDLPLPDSNDAVVQEIQAEAPKAPAIEVNS